MDSMKSYKWTQQSSLSGSSAITKSREDECRQEWWWGTKYKAPPFGMPSEAVPLLIAHQREEVNLMTLSPKKCVVVN